MRHECGFIYEARIETFGMNSLGLKPQGNSVKMLYELAYNGSWEIEEKDSHSSIIACSLGLRYWLPSIDFWPSV